MENQEPWELTFPAGYTLSPKAAYRGGISTRPNPWTDRTGQMANIRHLGRTHCIG